MNDKKEGRFRLMVAWLSWWLMLSSGGVVGIYVVGVIIFYFVGGLELLSAIWARTEQGNYLWVILASISGAPAGAWFGIRLWAKLMRKTGFISDNQVCKMSNYSKPSVG
ncbi:MAG: hypothetical protein ABL875_09020 [Candidatus Nitrotoga sp.]